MSWLQILVVSVITKMINTNYVSGKTGGTWKCTAKFESDTNKALTQFEVDTVVLLLKPLLRLKVDIVLLEF